MDYTELSKTIVAQILAKEGGYVHDPDDRGGETNFGITAAVARQCGYHDDMRDMPQSFAEGVYAKMYLERIACADIFRLAGASVAFEVADTAVNCGVSCAVKFLQRALNVFNQQGMLYADLVVDGGMGPMTLAALKDYAAHRDPMVLLKALNCLQGAHYIAISESRPKNQRFTYGWMRQRVQL